MLYAAKLCFELVAAAATKNPVLFLFIVSRPQLFEQVMLHLFHDPLGDLLDLSVVTVRSPHNGVCVVGYESHRAAVLVMRAGRD